SSTTTVGTPAGTRPAPSASVITATAPSSVAFAANRAPWVVAPGRAANRSPATTSAVDRLTPVTSTSSPVSWPPNVSATRASRQRGLVVGLTLISSTSPTYRPDTDSPVLLDLRRLGAGRGDAEALQGHRHDVVEHRTGHRAATGVARRLVDHDVGDEPRVVGRGEAHERDRVLAADVVAGARVDAPGGAGLARHPVALDLRGGGGALVGGDRLHHPRHLGGGLAGDDSLRRAGVDLLDRAIGARDRVDHPRRAHDAAVRDRTDRPDHLDRGDRDALTERD